MTDQTQAAREAAAHALCLLLGCSFACKTFEHCGEQEESLAQVDTVLIAFFRSRAATSTSDRAPFWLDLAAAVDRAGETPDV